MTGPRTMSAVNPTAQRSANNWLASIISLDQQNTLEYGRKRDGSVHEGSTGFVPGGSAVGMRTLKEIRPVCDDRNRNGIPSRFVQAIANGDTERKQTVQERR